MVATLSTYLIFLQLGWLLGFAKKFSHYLLVIHNSYNSSPPHCCSNMEYETRRKLKSLKKK